MQCHPRRRLIGAGGMDGGVGSSGSLCDDCAGHSARHLAMTLAPLPVRAACLQRAADAMQCGSRRMRICFSLTGLQKGGGRERKESASAARPADATQHHDKTLCPLCGVRYDGSMRVCKRSLSVACYDPVWECRLRRQGAWQGDPGRRPKRLPEIWLRRGGEVCALACPP